MHYVMISQYVSPCTDIVLTCWTRSNNTGPKLKY